jgi:hypothetical protein
MDLERKLTDFNKYYNDHRIHRCLNGSTPTDTAFNNPDSHASLSHHTWLTYRRGLYQLPTAA